MSALALGAYSLLLWLVQPAYALRLWRRGRVEALYRHALGERFGFYGRRDGDERRGDAGWVWVHAVSLGETRAAAALIDALRAARPGMKLLLTHGTATGREAGASLLRDGDVQVWLPFDTPGATRRFFTHFRPAVGVLMETEIWPNLLREAERARVPVVSANARLSARSLRRGLRLDALMRPAARRVTLALAQTDADALRLREAGAPRVEVSGNLKFDMTPEPALLERGHAWHALLAREVVLAASTREGEETMLLDAWLKTPAPRPLLLIVPRHPQRFDEVAGLVAAAGLTLARRSGWGDAPPHEALGAEVWLGDSMREMALYYAVAQVALLGGSFAPLGGQNLIEAAACGCPVVAGPHTFNFAEAAELAIEAGAALRVADIAAGVATARALLAAPMRLADAAARSSAFALQHQGAAARMAQRILSLIR
ncbi:MAG TPA: 3-deoxy-D-manno-octulosonic acid transferase [Burkholderiaceae bacterium]|jgi:3-deoxy-D-manno-octulosonic-acid transferase